MSVEELSRNALRIYVKLIESDRPLGVRELARDLDLPVSTVYYSLKKLEDLDLVRKSGDGYAVKRLVTPEGFLIVRRRLVPRLMVYSAFFMGIAVGESALTITSGLTPDRVMAIVAAIVSSIIFLLEGVAVRKRYG